MLDVRIKCKVQSVHHSAGDGLRHERLHGERYREVARPAEEEMLDGLHRDVPGGDPGRHDGEDDRHHAHRGEDVHEDVRVVGVILFQEARRDPFGGIVGDKHARDDGDPDEGHGTQGCRPRGKREAHLEAGDDGRDDVDRDHRDDRHEEAELPLVAGKEHAELQNRTPFDARANKKREAPGCPALNRYTRLIDNTIISLRRSRVTKKINFLMRQVRTTAVIAPS